MTFRQGMRRVVWGERLLNGLCHCLERVSSYLGIEQNIQWIQDEFPLGVIPLLGRN